MFVCWQLFLVSCFWFCGFGFFIFFLSSFLFLLSLYEFCVCFSFIFSNLSQSVVTVFCRFVIVALMKSDLHQSWFSVICF